MSASRPYYDPPQPTEPDLDDLYDVVTSILHRERPLAAGLIDVAGLVTQRIEPADGAGVALMSGPTVVSRVGSSSLVEAADEIQYRLGEGPCISAVREKRPICSGTHDPVGTPWPDFMSRIRDLGIGCVLSLPLTVRADVIGSLNVYALDDHALGQPEVAGGQQLARPVAAAIRSAQAERRLAGLSQKMHATLQTQALVADAVDLLSRREGCTRAEALELLGALAAQRGWSTAQIAGALLVDDH